MLSIPSDGRGARRPLGQSFHESVGPSALPAEKHDKCAAELFHKFKSVAPELVAKLLKSMGLNLGTWRSWDDYYGQNSELMVEAFAHPEKHERGKLGLLRLKLSELGIDVDAINAIRDYRDLKISFEELKERTRSHIVFSFNLPEKNTIPANLMPRLSGEALWEATRVLNQARDPIRKLQWLEVVQKLLEPEQPDYGVGVCLAKEIQSTLLTLQSG